MKRVLFLVFLSLLAINIYSQQKQPKIEAPELLYDFGDVQEGNIVKHEFVVKNTGDDVLEIKRVRASCGCTAAKPEKNRLAPGESTTIMVEFNSEDRGGIQRKHIYVNSNDPETPELRLSFMCNVLKKEEVTSELGGPKLKLSRNQHNFGIVNEGEVVSAELEFRNSGSELLKISEVKSSCGCTATVLSKKELKPGETGKIKIKLDTSEREGKITRTVTILSNDPQQPNQPITIYVNIKKRNT